MATLPGSAESREAVQQWAQAFVCATVCLFIPFSHMSPTDCVISQRDYNEQDHLMSNHDVQCWIQVMTNLVDPIADNSWANRLGALMPPVHVPHL